jgi:hypothetical protein
MQREVFSEAGFVVLQRVTLPEAQRYLALLEKWA